MKPLKPSMREKKRYFLVEGEINDVEKAVLDFIGTLGAAKASLAWIKKGKNQGIISVNRNSINHIRASFSVWPKIIKIKKVSGTLQGLKK